jgi:hypothetical protein
MADPDGPLWSWGQDGQRRQLLDPATRQTALDVLELGVDAAGWLAKAAELAASEARQAQARLDLQTTLDRIRTSPPSSRRPRLRAVP